MVLRRPPKTAAGSRRCAADLIIYFMKFYFMKFYFKKFLGPRNFRFAKIPPLRGGTRTGLRRLDRRRSFYPLRGMLFAPAA